MTKSLDVMTEAVTDNKHPFHQVDSRPDKPQKHRYERRKAKQAMNIVDWTDDADEAVASPPV